MYGGSSKHGRGRGGGGGGSGGPGRNRNSFPPPTNRQPSPVGRMSSGGGGGSSAAPRQRNNTSVKAAAASSRTVEETFSLVPRETPSAFGMIIRLAPDLVEEIKRVEAQGGAAKIKFDAFPNNSTGNIINVGGKEFKFTWSREPGDLCDIYEEHQSGEDGNGVLFEAGCAWRKLNVQRTLDESTTSHMKMRSVEAEQRTNLRQAIVLDPGNPSLTKQLALAEASPWRMSNKQKKEPPPKKRKVDPPPVPIGSPRPSFKPGASTTSVKNRLSASPGPSPSNQYNAPPSYGIGNIAKTHAANENVTQVKTKEIESMVASEKDLSSWENNALRDTSGRQSTNVNKEINLQTLMVDLLKEAPMSLKALEKAVGDRIPNAAKKIEPILKKIANFQAPRYFLKPGADLESYKKHSPDSRSSPEHQQLLPITECSRDQLPVPGGSDMEKFSVCQRNGEGSQDCLPVHLGEQLNAQENVDIEHHSPGILHEEKRSENRDDQARSSSSDSDSDNSDSESDSGTSSDSEASSNSKESSDEDVDVDIMSDGDKEPRQTIQSAEPDATDLPDHCSDAVDIEGNDSDAVDIDGHDSDAVDIDGHDSDAVDIDGHDSDAVDIDGQSSDEGHGSEADRKKFPDDNWKMKATTGTTPTTNEEIGISGHEQLPSGHDQLRERQNFIGQLFDDTENTKESLKNDPCDIFERLPKDQNQLAPALEHYSQQSARVKNNKSQQLPAVGKDSQPLERKYDVEHLNASANQMVDPLKGLQKSYIEKLNRHGQMKPVDSSGKSSKHSDALGNVRKSDEGDHFPHVTLSSRSGKAFRDSHRDDVHLKNKVPRNKKDGETAIRPSLPPDTSNRKHGELNGSEKDPKNVSGLGMGSSPLDSQRGYLAKLPKGNGSVLQKQVSDLELGELSEPLGVDTALKQLEERTSFRQSNLKPSTSENLGIDSDKRRSKKSGLKKPALTQASNGIKELPQDDVEDSERSQKWALQSHGHNLRDTENGAQNKNLEDSAYKSRQKDSRARVGSSVEGYGETNKKTPVIKQGSKRASTSRSSRENKRHASGKIANSINGHKDAISIPGENVVREKRVMSFDEEDSSYLKYEKASPDLKGPINDHLQYKAYVQEYLDKYDSYCAINKILESYSNNFQKFEEDLKFAKGRDMERYNKIVENLRESYCKYGERHKRLKKVFLVLHEELKQLKQRMKDYASSHGKD